jgi:hypothetical protein
MNRRCRQWISQHLQERRGRPEFCGLIALARIPVGKTRASGTAIAASFPATTPTSSMISAPLRDLGVTAIDFDFER